MVTEENFIFFIKKKREKGLDYLINNYGSLIKAIVSKHLYGMPERQDECINDILLKVWYGIDSYRGERQSFKYWLAAICKYACIDYKRKYLKSMKDENIDEHVVVDKVDIEESVIENELSIEIENLLRPLKPIDRQLFKKLYIDEIPIEEIAKVAGVTTSSLYSRISRCKKKIKEGVVVNCE